MTENNIGKFGDFIPEEEATPESQHPVLVGLRSEIANLESVKQAQSDTIIRLRDKWRTAEYSLESVLKELLDDEEISPENAQKIADIFDGITLTKQIEIEYTITATATVEVPYGSDPDDVANSTYVERVEFYTDFDGADVLESDHEAEDWRVR
jgi:hypothetical protein